MLGTFDRILLRLLADDVECNVDYPDAPSDDGIRLVDDAYLLQEDQVRDDDDYYYVDDTSLSPEKRMDNETSNIPIDDLVDKYTYNAVADIPEKVPNYYTEPVEGTVAYVMTFTRCPEDMEYNPPVNFQGDPEAGECQCYSMPSILLCPLTSVRVWLECIHSSLTFCCS